ncbi:hypothetical protein EG329_002056 [Mollisiaceae sp. DMI_Dod_QoI]|nr:hypothetical protein EG329_002056 [Helotiales sp. DMI_Dod_QoI]
MVLPNLRSKPSYKDLLKTLRGLEVKPKSWDSTPNDCPDEPLADESSVQNFLLSLFKTDLSWFDNTPNDELGLVACQQQKDEIVDLASRRLAERCGRAARGQDTRTFRLSITSEHNVGSTLEHFISDLELQIREPPLTGDNLGLKTWGSAWTMVKLLPRLSQHDPFQKLLSRRRIIKSTEGHCNEGSALQVLELGAGTGLVGMAAAAIWGVNVVLTDLPMIHENLQYNVNNNMPAISQVSNGHACAEILDWNDRDNALQGWPCNEFEIILAVDPLYDYDHPKLLADTIEHFSKRGQGHFVLTAVPLRDKTTESLCREFESLMTANGFENKYNGEDICRDDWESANANEVMVRWALWLGPDGDIC